MYNTLPGTWVAAAIWLCSLVLARASQFNRSALGNLRGAAGSVSVKVDRSHAFVASIALGTPPQHLKCLVDSGSADLWLPSKRCQDCGGEHHFFADASSTFAPKMFQTPAGPRPKAYQVTYGSGAVTGYGAQETFTFGPWKVKNQSFIIVEDQDLPPSIPWDGIFGLGWNGIAKVGKPVYQRLQEAGHPAIFALVPTHKGEASLVLGAVPEAKIKPKSLVWVKSEDIELPQQQGEEKSSFWIVSGGVAITQKEPRSEKFLVDTGTNQLLLVPTKLFPVFIRSLLPAESFERHCGMDAAMGNLIICDCAIGQSGELPPLRLYLGGRQFEVPIPELFTKVDARDGGEQLCLLQVQPNDMGPQHLGGMLGGLLPGLLNGSPFGLGGGGGASAALPPLLPPASSSQTPERHSSGQEVPPFPFKLPGFPGGLPNMPEMPKNLKPGESVEEIVETQPDGTVCTTSVISEPSGRTRKTRKCGPAQRRLQGGRLAPILQIIPLEQPGGQQQGQPMSIMQPLPMPAGGAMPMAGQPMEVPLEANPMADVWVLGGVFMEKFVTIFDFDQKRVGFAEPLNPVIRLDQTNYQQRSEKQAFLPAANPLASATVPARAPVPSPSQGDLAAPQPVGKQIVPRGGVPWLAVLMIIVFGAVCVLVTLFFLRDVPCRIPRNIGTRSSVTDEDNDFPGE